MIAYDADDLPGYNCLTTHERTVRVLWAQRRVFEHKLTERKEDQLYNAKQRILALDYYRKNRDAINEKRRISRLRKRQKALARAAKSHTKKQNQAGPTTLAIG